jgi:hypothetical protein
MNERHKPDWEALRRAYAPAPGGEAGLPRATPAPGPAQPPSASPSAQDDGKAGAGQDLAHDLAHGRAAILEDEWGMSQAYIAAIIFRSTARR